MNEEDPVAVIFWADNTWRYLEEVNLADYAHMSDDTRIVYLPGHLNYDQIECLVEAYNRGK